MKNILILLFILLSANLFAQEDSVKYVPVLKNYSEVKDAIKYPKDAETKDVNGRVKIKLHIDETGNVIEHSDYKGDSIFYEAVVNASYIAKFEPKIINGESVKFWVDFPFTFALGFKNRSKESEKNENE